ncbi:MAG: hypothetical protein HY554_07445 [Elusimicrobia bacterium]|nr:hypothetical protein [Elusimicrobiota bacterium]
MAATTRTPKQRRTELVILAAIAGGLLAYHAALVQRWVTLDRQPPGWDPAVHLGTALDYQEAWREGRALDVLLTKPRPGHPPYPPGYHYSLIPLLEHHAPHRTVAWLNLAYLMILVVSAGWIAWELGGVGPGAASLLVAGLSPGILFKYREAFPDLALAAWTSLAYALLLRSRLFERRGWSLAVGLCAGLAMQSKWGALLYLAPAWLSGWPEPARRRNLWRATALAAALCAPWYLVNGFQMLPRILAAASLGHAQGQPLTWTWANWWYYPDFWTRCFSGPGLALLAAGAALALSRSRSRERRAPGLATRLGPAAPALGADLLGASRLVIFAWVAFSYLFSTLVPSKDWRYILPATAGVPALGAAAMPVPGLAALALAAFWHHGAALTPAPGDWQEAHILAEVEARREPSRPVSTLCVLANHRNLNPTSLGWMARHKGLGAIAFGGHQTELPEFAEFVLAKTGDPGPFLSDVTLTILREAGANAGARAAGLFAKAFREVRRWPLPDGSEAVLFEVRPDLGAPAGPRRFSSLRVRGALLEGVTLLPRGGGSYDVTAATITLGKLPAPVRGVRARLEGARILESGGRAYVLGVDRLEVSSASVAWEDLAKALSQRSGTLVRVSAEGALITLGAGLGPIPVSVSFAPSASDAGLLVRLRRARLGLPVPFADRLWWSRSFSPRPPYQPYALVLAPFEIDARGLRIGGRTQRL